MSAMSRYDQEALGKRAEGMSQLAEALSPTGFGLAMMVFQFLVEIVKAITLGAEMIVRKDFGIRYLTPLRFFLGLWLIGPIIGVLSWLLGLGSAFFWCLTPFLILIFCLHYFSNNRKFWKQGVTWYTYSFGVSRFQWIIIRARQFNIPIIKKWDDWTLYRWIEPSYVLLLGLLLLMVSKVLGFYFLIASVGLFIKNQWEFMQQRGRFLDLIDAQIIGEYQQEALSGKPKEQTKGYSVVTPPADVTFDIDLSGTGDGPAREDEPPATPGSSKGDFSNTLDEMLAPASR